MQMDRYTVAGISLVLLGILWVLYIKQTGGSPAASAHKAGQRGGHFLTWLDMDVASALWMYPLFFVIWLGGNILFGNMIGISAIIEWINTLNTTGSFSLSPWVVGTMALAPSTAQWWLKQFAPPTDKTFWATWGLIGIDVALNTFGFWVLADMPLDLFALGVAHIFVLLLFVIVAAFVNIYCENMVHDALSRLMLWFKGKPVKGALP